MSFRGYWTFRADFGMMGSMELVGRTVRQVSEGSPRVDLRRVSVRRVTSRAEVGRWDYLMSKHHYLGFRGLVGGGVRQVAELADGTWVALPGWHAGSFKVGARDRHVGWTREQQFRRLRLVANNTRFLVLPSFEVPNLASRVLALSLRRLSGDMQDQTGHPVLLAETFVDPARFTGTCYRAASWRHIGHTRGYARVPGGGWKKHGQPKMVLVRELFPGARDQLRQLDDEPDWGLESQPARTPEASRLESLYEYLLKVPEYRCARGIRHRLSTVLAIALAAKLTGVRGVVAIGEFASRLTQSQLRAVGAFRSPSKGRYVAPSRATFCRILKALEPDVLDTVLSSFIEQMRSPCAAVAVDGKATSAEWMQGIGRDSERILVAAIEHGSGLVCGQSACGSAGGEIRGVRELLRRIDVAGRAVTLDALHTQVKTARLIGARGGFYLMTVKRNQPTLLDDLQALDWDDAAASEYETAEKAHGRIEVRRCRVRDLDFIPQEYVAMPNRRQAFRVERLRRVVRSGKTTREIVYGITSLGAQQAAASDILSLNRGHWEIENRLHHVRDTSYDEDRNRVAAKRLRRNLASLANTAISIVRLDGRFPYLPQAHRHFAARQGDAMRQIRRRNFNA